MSVHVTDHDRVHDSAHPTRFRFKRKRRGLDNNEPDNHLRSYNTDGDSKTRRHRHYLRSHSLSSDDTHNQQYHPYSSKRKHHHHHRRKRHAEASDNTVDDSSYIYTPPLDPQTAFRESLFDALADDEGAAYWEGVYGQPIHIYPDVKGASATGANGNEDLGELERMTDEEYASYVRARMFEKTHQHIIEERQRREEEREKKRTEQRSRRARRNGMDTDEAEYENLRQRIEDSLKRGRERKIGRDNKDKWKEAWRRYCKGWEDLTKELHTAGLKNPSADEAGEEEERKVGRMKNYLRDALPWPVQSGKWTDVSRHEIERFYRNAPPQNDEDVEGEANLAVLLKAERFRWHPDKVQHRFGGGDAVDVKTMERVTVVFQVVDGMRSDDKKASKKKCVRKECK